jgi:hypothetical protein
MELAKAKLQVIPADPSREPPPAVDVQFNPTTLRLQLANQTSGGNSRGAQVRQYTGTSSTTLTLDLVFDTADEGTTEQPRSVREKTAMVEKFVLPQGEGDDKQAPPKVRFQWGDLIIDGLVESVNIDFDHFAANGTPLRAKVALSIKEQDGRYMFLESGAGANAPPAAPTPGSPSAATPGRSGSGGDRSAPALAGESAADFAARMGLDPSAWRGLAAGLGASLSLEAGLEIGFSASLNAGIGIGVSVGVQAGASASLEVNLGLETPASAASSARAQATQNAGFNLSAAGGLGAAVESAKIANAQSAVAGTRAAFQQPATVSTPNSAPVQTSLPHQSRVPLASGAAGSTNIAPVPPRADPRASTYAFGVPLRSTVGAAALIRAGAMRGSLALRTNSSSDGEPPETFDPTTPKWIALPDNASGSLRRSAGRRRPLSSCGCSGGCGHK